jgi:hypothetical protein
MSRSSWVLAVFASMSLLAGCGSYVRSGPDGRGMMRVERCEPVLRVRVEGAVEEWAPQFADASIMRPDLEGFSSTFDKP